MAKKERLIKVTRDGRFHSMGLVVQTFDQAIERCTVKGIGNYFLEWPPEDVKTSKGVLEATAGVCGTPEYLKLWLDSATAPSQ